MFIAIKEIYLKRDLIFELALKDLKTRYSRPRLGFLWSLLTPLFTVGTFYLVFGKIVSFRVPEAPFFLYLMTGIFPWSFFQQAVLRCATSLVGNKGLIREANFPLYFLPLCIILADGVNFLPALSVVIATAAISLKGLPAYLWLLPLILLFQSVIALGLGLIFSLFYVRWRDIRYLLDALFLFLFYLTPAFYSLSLVKLVLPQKVYLAYLYNPLVMVTCLYRMALLKGSDNFLLPEVSLWKMLLITAVSAVGILLFAVILYTRKYRQIYDYLSY